ncbi:MAG: hypothetical protein U0235_04220 [Polyangiaceae bacterium]
MAPMKDQIVSAGRRSESGRAVKNAADAIIRANQAAYLEASSRRAPAPRAKMEAFAAARARPSAIRRWRRCSPSPSRPRFKLLVELGTNIGYGAIVMARAAGPEARVVTIELSVSSWTSRAGTSPRPNSQARHGAARRRAPQLEAFATASIDLRTSIA